jgi:hypothetical protein
MEAEHVADDDNLPMVTSRREVGARTYGLDDVAKRAFAHGYAAGASPLR